MLFSCVCQEVTMVILPLPVSQSRPIRRNGRCSNRRLRRDGPGRGSNDYAKLSQQLKRVKKKRVWKSMGKLINNLKTSLII